MSSARPPDPASSAGEEPVSLSRDFLLEEFGRYGKPRARWRVGGEFERAVVRSDGRPVGYFEPDGIRWILETMAARGGWNTVYEGENPIALLRNGAEISLEPGGQVELSGAPHTTLTALAEEMLQNRADLLAIAEGHDLVWTAAGLTPVASIDSILWVPKGRYDVMRAYLPQYGDRAVWMMKGTCSVQANYDYLDEADCARKVRLTSGLAPLTTAMFANSPVYEGKATGYKSTRGHIWTRVDPARTGFPPALRAAYTHEGWVDYLLTVPMMFYKRGATWTPANGRTFHTFMTEGFEGQRATLADWLIHQTSVFPEVRIKHTIEVRGADCVNHELAIAFCALFTGLLYCNTALDEALALVEEIERYGTHAERFDIAARDALSGVIGGRPLSDWASDLVDIAERGINLCLPGDAQRLSPLLEMLDAGRCPADDVLDALARDPSPENLVRAMAY